MKKLCLIEGEQVLTLVTDRAKARQQGLKKYFSNNPCSEGHNSQRFTDSAKCCECAWLKRDDVMTRKQAKELGLNKYFSNTPCVNGHNTYRWTSNYECCECKRIYKKDHRRYIKEMSDNG